MNTSFSYLRTPPQLYSIPPQTSQAFKDCRGIPRRRLFYNMSYTQQEMNKIEEFKLYAAKEGTILGTEIEHICRYLSSQNYNFPESLRQIKQFEQWRSDPTIQTLTSKSFDILANGILYTYGRDRLKRPVIVMDLTKVDFKQYQLKDYYAAMNALLEVVVNYRFVKGAIETYLFVVDFGGQNFTTINLSKVNQIIKKLAVIYSMYLGHMIAINAGRVTKIMYKTVSTFIHPQTLEKITLLDTTEKNKIKQYIDQSQLFEKYGGLQNNIDVYWPPKIPQTSYHNSKQQMFGKSLYNTVYQDTRNPMVEEQSLYYSVLERSNFNESMIEEESISSACCEGEKCIIF